MALSQTDGEGFLCVFCNQPVCEYGELCAQCRKYEEEDAADYWQAIAEDFDEGGAFEDVYDGAADIGGEG